MVMCSLFIRTTIFGTDIFFFHMKSLLQISRLCFAGAQATAYLLYPLLGWLSDVYFTRYKVIRLLFIVVCIVEVLIVSAAIAVLVDSNIVFEKVPTIILLLMAVPLIILMLISLGLFEANEIQFGMDQLLESSSDQLSSFINWYYWSSHIGHFILFLITITMVGIHSSCLIPASNYIQPVNDYIQGHLMFCAVPLHLVLGIAGLVLLIYTLQEKT